MKDFTRNIPSSSGQRFVVYEETCLLLTSSDDKHTEATEVVELRSSQEEADTPIVLHCKHMAAELSPDSTIVVRSPDTHVFILLLKFGQDILNPFAFRHWCGKQTASSGCTKDNI